MAALAGTLLGAGMGALTMIQNGKAKKEAKAELNKYERQDLTNAFEDMPISTMGADLAREEAAGNAATMVDTLQRGGSRSIFAGMPKVQEYLTNVNNQAALNLDNQAQRRDYAIAGDEARIRGIKEGRDQQNVAALSSQINAADQNIQNGMMGIASGLMYGARNIDLGKGGQTGQKDSFGNVIGGMEEMNVGQGESTFVDQPIGIGNDYNYNPMNPFGNNNIATKDIWGQDAYGPEFYNKYFAV